jgi:hypothetical protein
MMVNDENRRGIYECVVQLAERRKGDESIVEVRGQNRNEKYGG